MDAVENNLSLEVEVKGSNSNLYKLPIFLAYVA
jgi:hypothetical protein